MEGLTTIPLVPRRGVCCKLGGEGKPPLDVVLKVRRGEDGVWTRVPGCEPPDDERDDIVRFISKYPNAAASVILL